MECNKIKSLLSEYLDKTLRSDLSRDVKAHLLSCKDCSNEFFLIKSVKGELAGLERIKAPSCLLNRVNQAVSERSWLAKLFDFIPGSGGFKVPMEFVTLAATAALIFLIFTNIHVEKNENAMVADSGNPKTFFNPDSNDITGNAGPVQLDFIPVSGKNSETLPSANVLYSPSGRRSGNSDSSDLFDMLNGESPASRRNSLVSRLREMTLMAGGDIIAKELENSTGAVNAVTVKIPSDKYDSFIRRAEEIGRFHPPAPALSNQSTDPVLLRIRLDLSE